MHLRRLAIPVIVLGGFALTSCGFPETTAEAVKRCDTMPDPISCINGKIIGDTAQNAVIGGILGATTGAAVAIALHNPTAAVKFAAAGGATAAAGAGLATYYIEHQNADALQDIQARNRQLTTELQVYGERDRMLKSAFNDTKLQLAAITTVTELQRKLLQDEISANKHFAEQNAAVLSALNTALDEFKRAVTLKYGQIPSTLDAQLKEFTGIAGQLPSYEDEAHTRAEELEQQLKHLQGGGHYDQQAG